MSATELSSRQDIYTRITASIVASTTLTLSWTKATDAVTAQASLQYAVYRSLSDNISSSSSAEANGTLIQAYTTDIATLAVTGLSASTPYFFNVIVKDAADNRAAYETVSATTAAASITATGGRGGMGRTRARIR